MKLGDLRSARGPLPWIVLLVLVLGWLGVSELWVPRVVASAYRGESWAPVNALLSGRSLHPVERYTDAWRALARPLTATLLAACALLLALSRPALQRLLDALLPPPPPPPGPVRPMSAGRKLLATTLIGVVVAGSGAATLYAVEMFPFSPYPMYSGLTGDTIHQYRIFGITAEGEVPLDDERFWQPLGRVHLSYALQGAAHRPEKLKPTLREALRRYTAGREAGRHDGPALEGLRFYRLEWELDPRARNVDEAGTRELVAELRRAP